MSANDTASGELQTDFVTFDGGRIRVWRKGRGPKLTFLAGFGGLPRWTPFLDELAQSRTVIVPSVPGFPGADPVHLDLDNHLDWLVAMETILHDAGSFGGALVGSSVGGALAADVAAVWRGAFTSLCLIGPLGIFEEDEPTADPWAQRSDRQPALMTADPALYSDLRRCEDGNDATEWRILQVRADAASARLLWPLADTGLRKRLNRIDVPTKLIWGEKDAIVPPSYAARFSAGMSAPVETTVIPDAGHLAWLDQPKNVARAVLS